tara:strand:- start:365 stop:646 length:282 start_codon:yes stop_codon:yes gene_type:complete
MTSKDSKDRLEWGLIVNITQTVVLILTVGAAFMTIGETKQEITSNSESIRDLRDVSGDLVEAMVEATVNDARHFEMLTELRRRVGLLERVDDR